MPQALNWSDIDTVLLDMDGTLLDLNYDNHLWNNLLPQRFAKAQGLTEPAAQQKLFEYMSSMRGTLEFYCLDHWAEFSQLDMRDLHLARTDLVCYRPGALEFLAKLSQQGIRSVLVTNAHRLSLDVKDSVCQVSTRVDQVVSCHDYGAPKESQLFWQRLHQAHPFDANRALFIDDNHDVLESASEYGISHLRTISYPDSQREAKPNGRFTPADDLAQLLP